MDVTDSELSGTDSSSDDDSIGEDDQGAVHWDEPDEELDRDLLNPGGVNGRSPNKAYQFVLWILASLMHLQNKYFLSNMCLIKLLQLFSQVFHIIGKISSFFLSLVMSLTFFLILFIGFGR